MGEVNMFVFPIMNLCNVSRYRFDCLGAARIHMKVLKLPCILRSLC